MSEFTGERVIPELVDADLLNEHLARYRFAKHLASGMARPLEVLDAGCGSGYGTAELAGVGISVTGTDISAEAVEHARQRYGANGVQFLQAPCEALPFEPARFDLITAFEVIEHLKHWQELLREANRVLKPSGALLVSTPNRDYYEESRGAAGPNPFHLHEFDFREFREALEAVFPHVRIWTQNHSEAIVFGSEVPTGAALEISGTAEPASAHFYLAACSQSPVVADGRFAWVPSSANVLRERERHIAKLGGELAQKDVWLKQTLEAHSELQRNHEALMAELERQNNWAGELNNEVAARNTRIGDLQKEVETRLTWISDLESQISGAAVEIERLNAEEAKLRRNAQSEIARQGAEIQDLQTALTERTAWAESLNGEIVAYREELQRIASSNWFRTGAKLGLGPRSRDGQ